MGDAGDHKEAGETLVNLRRELISHPNSAVIFLGDNSYKDVLGGIIPFGFKGFDSSKNTIAKLRSQLNLMNEYKGWVYFTPGNHDWWNRTSYAKGKAKLQMEESFIESNLKMNTSIANPDKLFLPANGIYGPEYVELNHQTIRLVFFDSYRIIQTGIKKNNPPEAEKSFYHNLDSVIHDGYLLKQRVVVISHHPVYLRGPYDRTLKHPYLFARIKASNSSFPSYKTMIDSLEKVLKRYPGIYYVSGHVHALQYFNNSDSVHYIISGAGSKEIKLSEKQVRQFDVSVLPDEYLLWNTGGFFELDFQEDRVNTVLYYNEGSLKCTLP
ncbi:MAG TPA: metallophosphoesterase [Puia sp.]